MFSHRLPFHLPRNPISDALERRRASGLEILDLTESNPTRAGIVYPAAEILAGFGNPESLVYDPSSTGLAEARAQVAALYEVAHHRVVLTASSSEAYSWLFKLLCDPGDEILTPRPSYPLFEFLAALESVRIRQYPLRYDDGWFIDFDPLESSIGEKTRGEKTRAIVVVSPNNPTGSYLKRWELDRLRSLCARHNLALISDEVFSDYSLKSVDSRSLTCVDDVLTFCLGGLSKMVGTPQMKLGWMIAGGPQPVLEAALARIDLIADNFLSVGTPVQYALPNLLNARSGIQKQIVDRLRQNLAVLEEAVRGNGDFRLLDVEGGWYAILRAPRVRSEEEWVLGLLSRGVLVQPGYFYDFESEAYLVVSLLTPEDAFREGVRRMLTE
jgi:aspartate/methionine/tyrosine aminotransferase